MQPFNPASFALSNQFPIPAPNVALSAEEVWEAKDEATKRKELGNLLSNWLKSEAGNNSVLEHTQVVAINRMTSDLKDPTHPFQKFIQKYPYIREFVSQHPNLPERAGYFGEGKRFEVSNFLSALGPMEPNIQLEAGIKIAFTMLQMHMIGVINAIIRKTEEDPKGLMHLYYHSPESASAGFASLQFSDRQIRLLSPEEAAVDMDPEMLEKMQSMTLSNYQRGNVAILAGKQGRNEAFKNILAIVTFVLNRNTQISSQALSQVSKTDFSKGELRSLFLEWSKTRRGRESFENFFSLIPQLGFSSDVRHGDHPLAIFLTQNPEIQKRYPGLMNRDWKFPALTMPNKDNIADVLNADIEDSWEKSMSSKLISWSLLVSHVALLLNELEGSTPQGSMLFEMAFKNRKFYAAFNIGNENFGLLRRSALENIDDCVELQNFKMKELADPKRYYFGRSCLSKVCNQEFIELYQFKEQLTSIVRLEHSRMQEPQQAAAPVAKTSEADFSGLGLEVHGKFLAFLKSAEGVRYFQQYVRNLAENNVAEVSLSHPNHPFRLLCQREFGKPPEEIFQEIAQSSEYPVTPEFSDPPPERAVNNFIYFEEQFRETPDEGPYQGDIVEMFLSDRMEHLHQTANIHMQILLLSIESLAKAEEKDYRGTMMLARNRSEVEFLFLVCSPYTVRWRSTSESLAPLHLGRTRDGRVTKLRNIPPSIADYNVLKVCAGGMTQTESPHFEEVFVKIRNSDSLRYDPARAGILCFEWNDGVSRSGKPSKAEGWMRDLSYITEAAEQNPSDGYQNRIPSGAPGTKKQPWSSIASMDASSAIALSRRLASLSPEWQNLAGLLQDPESGEMDAGCKARFHRNFINTGFWSYTLGADCPLVRAFRNPDFSSSPTLKLFLSAIGAKKGELFIPEGIPEEVLKMIDEVDQETRSEQEMAQRDLIGAMLDRKLAKAIAPAFIDLKMKEIVSGQPPEAEENPYCHPYAFIQHTGFPPHSHVIFGTALTIQGKVVALIEESKSGVENSSLTTLIRSVSGGELVDDQRGTPLPLGARKELRLYETINQEWKTNKPHHRVIPIVQTLKSVERGTEFSASERAVKGKDPSKAPQARSQSLPKERIKESLLKPLVERERSESSESEPVVRNRGAAFSKSAAQKAALHEELPQWLKDLKAEGNLPSYLIEMMSAAATKAQKKVNSLIEFESEQIDFQSVTDFGAIVAENGTGAVTLIDDLRFYQKKSVEKYLAWERAGLSGIFGHEPGLGKTRTSCEVLLQTLLKDPSRPCLVLAPLQVAPQWAGEFERAVGHSILRLFLRVQEGFDPAFLTQFIKKQPELLWSFLPFQDGSRQDVELGLQRIRERLGTLPKPQQKDFLETLPALGDDLLKSVNELRTWTEKLCQSGWAIHHQILLSLVAKQPAGRNDKEQLAAFQRFCELFPGPWVRHVNDARTLVQMIQKGARGIIAAPYSTLEAAYAKNPQAVYEFNPQVTVLDEASEKLVAQSTNSKAKETYRDIFSKWSGSKVALTATPLVNSLNDLSDLLEILNPNIVKARWSDPVVKGITSLQDRIQKELDKALALKEMIPPQQLLGELLKKTLYHIFNYKQRVVHPLFDRVTWKEVEATDSLSIPQTNTITLQSQVSKEQQQLANKVSRMAGSFFHRMHSMTLLSIHPVLVKIEDEKVLPQDQEKVDHLIREVASMNREELESFIRRSGPLTKIFLDEDAEGLSITLRQGERALLFTNHQNEARLLKVIAEKWYELPPGSVVEAHSGITERNQVIEKFKRLDGPGLLILLPKSGSSGLNFTNVRLNILAARFWTYSEFEQAQGRIKRGLGTKNIALIRTGLPDDVHQANTVKRKELESELLVGNSPVSKDTLLYWQKVLIQLAEYGVISGEKYAFLPEITFPQIIKHITKTWMIDKKSLTVEDQSNPVVSTARTEAIALAVESGVISNRTIADYFSVDVRRIPKPGAAGQTYPVLEHLRQTGPRAVWKQYMEALLNYAAQDLTLHLDRAWAEYLTLARPPVSESIKSNTRATLEDEPTEEVGQSSSQPAKRTRTLFPSQTKELIVRRQRSNGGYSSHVLVPMPDIEHARHAGFQLCIGLEGMHPLKEVQRAILEDKPIEEVQSLLKKLRWVKSDGLRSPSDLVKNNISEDVFVGEPENFQFKGSAGSTVQGRLAYGLYENKGIHYLVLTPR